MSTPLTTAVGGGDAPAAWQRPIETPEELATVMRTPYSVSAQQWEAVRAPLEPGVVIAGAGSGKTTLMTARVVYLVVTGQVRPEQVLGLTFTTKAAAELRGRVREALEAAGVLRADDGGEEALEPTVATYHAYAASLLTEHGLRIGHEPDTRVITDASRYQLGARVVARHTGEVSALSDHPPTVIQYLLALDAAMSEHLVGPDDVRRTDEEAAGGLTRARQAEVDGKGRKTYVEAADKALDVIARRAEVLGLVEGYRRLKRDLGLMDFSDQIALVARLAREHPGVGVLERDRFRVVLLDEYQDTSVAQAEMLRHLFSGSDAVRGRGHPVTAVGDPNQAIYGWRGASVSNILGFAETFPAAGGGAVPLRRLTVNRRSERRILRVANRLAEPLLAAFGQVAPLEPAPGAGEGEVGVRVFESQAEELAWLAESVRAAYDEGGSWADIGVLARNNSTAEKVFDALTGAGIPVEIVGLAGLLRLPEVAEVVAVLRLLQDVTDNAALLTLLTGPRWAVGHRDLRLLAARARGLAGAPAVADPAAAPGDLDAGLRAIAEGIDPAEVPALHDALDDPGDAAYSVPARERFGLLSAELRTLRGHLGEPLLDLVRRILDLTGVEVELASTGTDAARARAENLDLFVKAVAEFASVDGEVTLPALLAYLTAEDDFGQGLDVATPSESDSVKLLTVHRAKGLEWRSVFVVGVCDSVFPSSRGRSVWVSAPAVLPAPLRGDARDQPQLAGWDKPALDAYRVATREHEATEELRLGYVALTRAARRLWVTSYLWGERGTAYGPSAYQETVRADLEEHGEEVAGWLAKPERGTANPLGDGSRQADWPVGGIGAEAARRREAAALVAHHLAEADLGEDADPALDMVELALVQTWDDEIDRLLAEVRQEDGDLVRVPLPGSLSATALARLRDDPAALAQELARPMPRRPSRAARFGTRFHAWVEARFGQQDLFEPDELPGRGDTGIEDERELAELTAAFEAGRFADWVPLAVEASFAVVLAGQVVRGRIDAVYADGPDRFLVVDWKTNRAQTADPQQLAIYRLAWAELHGVPLDHVRAGFYYVRTDDLVLVDELADRPQLEELVRAHG